LQKVPPRTPSSKTLNILTAPVGRRFVSRSMDRGSNVPHAEICETVPADANGPKGQFRKVFGRGVRGKDPFSRRSPPA